MTNMELQLDHEGALHLLVAGHHALGATVLKIDRFDGDLAAVVLVPLKHTRMTEATNVIPLVRPATK